jgi:hypothetical protein
MMKVFILSLSISFVYCGCIIPYVVVHTSVESVHNCNVQYLKSREKLDVDFPIRHKTTRNCTEIIRLTRKLYEDNIAFKLYKEEKPKCLIEEVEKADLVDFLIKRDVLLKPPPIEEEILEVQLATNSKKIKEILGNAWKACDMTTPYGKAFDVLLGRVRDVKIREVEKYCKTKYSIDHELIDVPEVIDESFPVEHMDCDLLIVYHRDLMEKFVEEDQRSLVTEKGLKCILDTFKEIHVFDWFLAEDAMDMIDVPDEVEVKNREHIYNKIKETDSMFDSCRANNPISN